MDAAGLVSARAEKENSGDSGRYANPISVLHVSGCCWTRQSVSRQGESRGSQVKLTRIEYNVPCLDFRSAGGFDSAAVTQRDCPSDETPAALDGISAIRTGIVSV